MELEVRDKNIQRNQRLIRYAAIVVLVPLLGIYIGRINSFNHWLIHINNGGAILPVREWTILVKLISYLIQILLNFCLLLAFTNRLKYSLFMVYIAFFVLMTGMALVCVRDFAGVNIPLTFIAFFVKINKSFILLVLFIAGHIVNKRMNVKS